MAAENESYGTDAVLQKIWNEAALDIMRDKKSDAELFDMPDSRIITLALDRAVVEYAVNDIRNLAKRAEF